VKGRLPVEHPKVAAKKLSIALEILIGANIDF
jgi:hypothetical protein